MAHIQVTSDDGTTVTPITTGTDDDGAWTTAVCPLHGDHSYFENLAHAGVIHLDHHPH